MTPTVVRVYCVDCGAETEPYTVDNDERGLSVGVEKCHCRAALSRPAIVELVVEIARSQKTDVMPNRFVEYCRAIENYIAGPRQEQGNGG